MHREHTVPIAGRVSNAKNKNKTKNEGGEGYAARLDENNTCTAQTYTSYVGARVGPLQSEGHEKQVLTFASHRVSKTDSR